MAYAPGTGSRSAPTPSATTSAVVVSDDFDDFFVTHHGRLVRTMTMITGDAELAADAVAEAFTRAYARWGRVRRHPAPVAWVRRVALNRSRDLLRSEERRRRREARTAPPEAVSDPEPATLDLPTLLAGLPARRRTAMVLHYLEDLSVADTAEAMGCSVGAVKYHLHEGRAALRPLLEGHERR